MRDLDQLGNGTGGLSGSPGLNGTSHLPGLPGSNGSGLPDSLKDIMRDLLKKLAPPAEDALGDILGDMLGESEGSGGSVGGVPKPPGDIIELFRTAVRNGKVVQETKRCVDGRCATERHEHNVP